MARGQVKWFDSKKGFGFIYGPDGQDVFVHFSNIEGKGFRCLQEREEVEYTIVKGEKGLSAQHVVRLHPDAKSNKQPPEPASAVA